MVETAVPEIIENPDGSKSVITYKEENGEKTMEYIWTKVLEDLRNNQLSIEKIQQYVQESADIKATKGRASYVGERSIGHIDPGTCSSGYLFEALVEAGV